MVSSLWVGFTCPRPGHAGHSAATLLTAWCQQRSGGRAFSFATFELVEAPAITPEDLQHDLAVAANEASAQAAIDTDAAVTRDRHAMGGALVAAAHHQLAGVDIDGE